jgi:hypothetical protein
MPTLTFSNSPNQETFCGPADRGLAQRRASASGAGRRGRSATKIAPMKCARWRPDPVVSDPSRTCPAWQRSPLPGLGRYKSARDRLSSHHDCSGLWVGNVN